MLLSAGPAPRSASLAAFSYAGQVKPHLRSRVLRSSTALGPVAALVGGPCSRQPARLARRTGLSMRPMPPSRSSKLVARAFFDKLFKQDPSEKTRKQYQERVDAINALEPAMAALSDAQLREKTAEFKSRVAGGESLESLLPEAFAVRAG